MWLAVIYGSTIETLQQSTRSLLFTAAASFGGGKFPNDGRKVPISTRRRPYEFANLRPTSTRAFRSNRFIVRFPLRYRKNLPGAVDYRRAILCNDKRAGEDKSTDRKKMPVTALARSGRERLRFDFGVTSAFSCASNSLSFIRFSNSN